MAFGDIYRIFVKFKGDPKQGKERFTVEIGKASLTVVLLDTITSQYGDKSDYIKLQYYPIRDWRQAGLKKPSYIDILSTSEFDFRELMKASEHTGKLSDVDVQEFAQFVQSYKQRLLDFKNQSN